MTMATAAVMTDYNDDSNNDTLSTNRETQNANDFPFRVFKPHIRGSECTR